MKNQKNDLQKAKELFKEGNINLKKNSYQKAEKNFTEAIKYDPDVAIYHSSLGDVSHVLNLKNQAVIAYKKSIELGLKSPEIYHKLSYCYYKLNNYEKAIDCLNKAIQLDDNKAIFHESQGDILQRIGNFHKAAKRYSRAIELSTNKAPISFKCSECCIKIDKKKDALEHIRKAVQIEPNNPTYLFQFAEILYELGQFGKAIEIYQKAIKNGLPILDQVQHKIELCQSKRNMDNEENEQSGSGDNGLYDCEHKTKKTSTDEIIRKHKKYNVVWISLEQGMHHRSNYFQYAIDHILHKNDLKKAIKNWGPAHTNGPGNFHLPEKLDGVLNPFISFERLYTCSTATASSVAGGLSGIPHVFHSLSHIKKTDLEAPKAGKNFPSLFDILRKRGYNVSGFHIFKDVGPGFILPDFGQGHNKKIDSWPSPIPSHLNYVSPVARLENHLNKSKETPHAIFIHLFAQATPAVLEILNENGITFENTIFLIIGDHGHPNWDFDGKEWPAVHDIEVDALNTQIFGRFYYPGCKNLDMNMPCSNLDFFHTIMTILDIPMQNDFEYTDMTGNNLLPYFEGKEQKNNRILRNSNRYHFQLGTRTIALIGQNWRYEYMHFSNIFLNDYFKINYFRRYHPESLFRVFSNGYDSPVNIENSRVSDLLKKFRKLRIIYDKQIQKFWIEKIEKEMQIPIYIKDLYNSINPYSDDLEQQIKKSERMDFCLKKCIESQRKIRIELLGEIKYAVEPNFYYKYFLTKQAELINGKVAIWGTGEYYQKYVCQLINKFNIQYFISENSKKHNTTIDGLPVYGPNILEKCPVDVVLICHPMNEYWNIVKKVRSMKLSKQPAVS